MKAVAGRLVRRVRDGEPGFTLIEMLIVVGIITALAITIVPQVVQFAGRGAEGSKETELNTVRSAISGLLAEETITSITATSGGVRDWTLDHFGVTVPPNASTLALSPAYLRQASTTYWYCIGTTGGVTQHNLPFPDQATAPSSCTP